MQNGIRYGELCCLFSNLKYQTYLSAQKIYILIRVTLTCVLIKSMRLYNSTQEIEYQAHIKSFKTGKKIFLGKIIVAKKILKMFCLLIYLIDIISKVLLKC